MLSVQIRIELDMVAGGDSGRLLLQACETSDLELVTLLLDNGACKLGWTDLCDMAKMRVTKEMCQLLVERGGRVQTLGLGLRRACQYGNIPLVEVLMETEVRESVLNIEISLEGICVASSACAHILRLLLSNPNVNPTLALETVLIADNKEAFEVLASDPRTDLFDYRMLAIEHNSMRCLELISTL